MPEPLLVVGDALLDRDVDGRVDRVAPDVPVPVVSDPVTRARPGGAALAAALIARDGHEVVLATALADDPAGRELARLISAAGVVLVDLGREGRTPEKIRISGAGHTLVRVDHDGDLGELREPERLAEVRARIGAPTLVSDYGRGLLSDRRVRSLLMAAAARAPLVWDPHPRGAAPVAGCVMVTPNASEASALTANNVREVEDATAAARELCRQWGASTVAVTLGAAGAVLSASDGPGFAVPAARAVDGDACGAGDRFAAAVLGALADGMLPTEAVTIAVDRATAFVAADGARRMTVDAQDGIGASRVDRTTRRSLRTRVVATSGCFDLLHAGHVASLEAARALGDRLVVLLNSDRSVRRLKGPGRPIVPEHDRAAVLRGLACVDAVEVFDDDTPAAALSRLRPALFVKGGDYSGLELPEQAVMAEWGGEVVIVPYLGGRSTSRLVDSARDAG